MSVVQRFFEPIKELSGYEGINYEKASPVINTLITISKISNNSIYIVDYIQRKFLYVSSQSLFLAGYNVSQVKEWGYEYYEKVVPADDLNMLLEINKYGFGFFYDLPVELRTQCFISYDFRIKHQNGNTILINHKLIPFYLTDDGNIWLALCNVNHSTNEKPGNVIIHMLNEQLKYSFCFKSKKFIPFQIVALSEREKQILELAAQGYSASEMASNMCIDLNTVKYHKRNIFKKLGVKNISEAVYYMMTNTMQV